MSLDSKKEYVSKAFINKEALEKKVRKVNATKIKTRLAYGLELSPEQKKELLKLLEEV